MGKTAAEIVKDLRAHSNPRNVAGMARFGISAKGALGVNIPILRKMAKTIGRDQKLADDFWKTGIHEARLLAGFIGEADKFTPRKMDAWAKDFDSWDICDQVCSNLFDKTPYAYDKALEWSKNEKEFIKRAGFVLMAALAVHDKKADDKNFEKFFSVIVRESDDERNFVRKAVNWALRQIGKRSRGLRHRAIEVAAELKSKDSKAARWIGSDAFRELTGEPKANWK
ncbi:MAG: DNA alkylation repair protein [Patescibacteria group bacterium]